MALFNTLLLLLVALAIPGLINRTRARLAGRKGIRFTQHLHNVRLLLNKGAVYSTTTSTLFRAAPSVYLASAIIAALLIPVGDLWPLISFDGDLVAFAYLLALGRMALILAAMDTGSSFEGMGASREALYGALVEPALMLTFGTFALLMGFTSFEETRLLRRRSGLHQDRRMDQDRRPVDPRSRCRGRHIRLPLVGRSPAGRASHGYLDRRRRIDAGP